MNSNAYTVKDIKIVRHEDRQTGEVCYRLDQGGPQIISAAYATRADAEAALAAATAGDSPCEKESC